AGRDAHRASGAGDDLCRLLDVVGVEVLHLHLGDLTKLVSREVGHLGLVRLAGALGHAGSLLDQLGGRGRLGDEGERAVLVDRDLHGDDVATLGLGRGVVGLDELHDVDTVLTEGGAHGRGRGRCTGLDLQLDEAGDLLLLLGRHCLGPCLLGMVRVTLDGAAGLTWPPSDDSPAPFTQILATWLNESSTGVSRPKIETSTLSFWLSGLISEMVAGRVSNGPSITVTDSPTSKSTMWVSPAFAPPPAPVTSPGVSKVGLSMV